MATFEQHIESLTSIDITTTSGPTIDELTQFLQEGIVDCVNKMVKINPSEAFKFAAESEAADDTGITVTGQILSVVREHDSTSILRACTPISAEVRYESTDVESLHYRSKYNPGYYVLNGKIHVRPAAAGCDNDMKVSQIAYDTGESGVSALDNYNQGAVSNFPTEYESLIAIYGAAKTCHVAAQDIQNNMPDKPTPPERPIFTSVEANEADLPIVSTPTIDISRTIDKVNTKINADDLEAADKVLNILDKEMEQFSKKLEIEKAYNERSDSVFKADVERLLKDADRTLQSEVAEFKHAVEKYTQDVAFYNAELSEKLTKYKWYMEQYMAYTQQYNAAISSTANPAMKQQPKEQKKQRRRKGDR